MNIPIPSVQEQPPFFFLRTADRLRLEACINALAGEGLSLILSCEREALLDHYGNALIAGLRQRTPAPHLEIYFPANTDSLIARFNEALASQSLSQATQATAAGDNGRIWIVHDAQTLPAAEIQLLARLIQNFPGANIRALLLFHGQQARQEALSAFGRKLLRWEIEPPTPAQAEDALALARLEGREEAVANLLKRVARQPLADILAVAPAPAPAPLPEAADTPPATVEAAKEAKPRRQFNFPRLRLPSFQRIIPKNLTSLLPTRNRPLLLAAGGLLITSILVTAWLQPQAFKSPFKAAPRAAVSPVKDSEAKPPVMLPSQGPAADNQAPAVVAPQPAAPPPEPVAATPPDPLAQGREWIASVEPNTFIIQSGTADSFAKAERIRKSYRGLKDAYVVAAYRPGDKGPHYVIVHGPFRQIHEALDATHRSELPRSCWVRVTRTLQEQLKPRPLEPTL